APLSVAGPVAGAPLVSVGGPRPGPTGGASPDPGQPSEASVPNPETPSSITSGAKPSGELPTEVSAGGKGGIVPGDGGKSGCPELKEDDKPGPHRTQLSDVRVAVSVLSDDGQRVYYISWPPESSSRGFPPRSLAYVAVAVGVARWWREGYE